MKKTTKKIIASIFSTVIILASTPLNTIFAQSTEPLPPMNVMADEDYMAKEHPPIDINLAQYDSDDDYASEHTEGVTQSSILASQIPNGFDQTVSEFADGLRIGWNLGNTLDSYDGTGYLGPNPTPSQIEIYWANPITTKTMIEKVKEAGFNAVRIPVTWFTFTGPGPDYTIRSDWMSRVQEVVDFAIDLDMYVILNVHHDDAPEYGWLLPIAETKDASLYRLDKIWEQIANNFKDYPSNLIFEGMNEIFLADSWTGTPERRAIVNEFNQQFVDTVRSTGGNNQYRYLMCPTHGAAAADEAFLGFVLPDDDRLMLSVHIYETINDLYNTEDKLIKLKANFIENGIPVIIGESGSSSNLDINTRVEYADKFVSLVNRYGAKCFWWDDGGKFLLLNRRTLQWQYPVIVEAMMEAFEKPFEDPFNYVHRWTPSLNAFWGGSATYNDDGSMNVVWAGKAGQDGKQNQYASKFTHSGVTANAAIARAKREGRTIEFTVKFISGKNQNGSSLTSMQFKSNGAIPTSDAVWINMGSEKTFKIDVSSLTNILNKDSIIQLIVQNYSISSMQDVEIWVSPITVSEPTN